MGNEDETQEENEENVSTVGSGRLNTLFDDIESTVESLEGFSDELVNVRRRIEANEGETSDHVRDRVNEDADQLADQAEEGVERLREELQELKQTL